MKVKKNFILVFSVLFFSLTVLGLTLGTNSPVAFGQNDLGVGVGIDSEMEIKVGEGSEESTEVSVEGKTETSAEITTPSKTDSTQNSPESETSEQMESEIEGESMIEININTSYPKMKADSENEITVQAEQAVYKPGETVKVEGSVWLDLITLLGGPKMITIQILDSSGTLVKESSVEMKSDGSYQTEIQLPATSINGDYSVKSKINVEPSILATVQLESNTQLESSTKILVSTPMILKIQVEGHDDFEVKVSSNSKVSDVEFKEKEKKITFQVEGETGTQGKTKIEIPKKLLSGQMSVLIDGRVMAKENVILTANTEAATTLELNYNHSVHNIEIIGTSAVPEFGTLALIILVTAISAIVLLSRRKGNILMNYK